MHDERPDFSDAGYAQLGCPLIAVSSVVGSGVGLFVSWLTWEARDPAQQHSFEEPWRIIVGAMTIGVAAMLLAMWVIDRTPRLWRRHGLILFWILLLGPGAIAATVMVTGPESVTFAVVSLAATAGLVIVVVGGAVEFVRAIRH